MEIIEFQNKLKDIQRLAANNKKRISQELIEKYFAEDGLDEEKVQMLYDYLEIQGIHVEGHEKREDNPSDKLAEEKKKEFVVLSDEEEAYLKEYRKSFSEVKAADYTREALVKKYQEEVIEVAKELNCEEIFYGDLLQEGNMGLLMELEKGEENPEKISRGIRKAIIDFINAQTQQKKEDDILVEKVQELEAKVKELTEEDNIKYTEEELAAFLDMDIEEMRAVLRLTGDDE